MIGFRVGLLTRSLRSLVAGRAGGQNCGMKMRKSIACDYAMCYNDIAMDKTIIREHVPSTVYRKVLLGRRYLLSRKEKQNEKQQTHHS